MNCPNCGKDMKEGSLYCEHCGEDIHIVPDFEPELEYSLERNLNDIIMDIRGNTDEEIPEELLEEELSEESGQVQDWDAADMPGRQKSYKKYFLLGMLIGLLVLIAVGSILVSRHYSLEYQTTMAQKSVNTEQYDKAVSYYNRALELEPDSVDLKFSLAEVFFLKNNKIEYEYLLRDIVSDKNASAEQLESAYGRLIAIYRAREDYDTINELLLASGNESIISKYQSYIAVAPEFSIKEGNYTSIQPLKLTNFGTGKIYYTLDGSEPNENSALYTAPILLENGTYCVKACYISELGIVSEVVTKNYTIEIELLPSPEISAVSGDYEFPINIEVTSDYQSVYYTKDGSVPTAESYAYNGAIPMPLGVTTFKFIRIEEGRTSEVVERTYTLKMNTDFTPEQAVEAVVNYCLEAGKITNIYGDFDETDAVYQYEYQYVTNINGVDDFYVVAEIFRDENLALTKTGNYFAVNAYTEKVSKLQIDDYGNYNLIEIIETGN